MSGQLRITHDINSDASIELKHNTEGDTEVTLDLHISKNATLEVSRDNEGDTNVSLNIKI